MTSQKDFEISEPLRTSLFSDVINVEQETEFSNSVSVLKDNVYKHLFLWKTFPVVLPDSILKVSNQTVDSVFIAPEFDECELLSKDSSGNSRPLSRRQLAQLRQTARFDVESSNFPGEVHTWKISSCLLKGKQNIRSAFREDLCTALSYLVVHALDRIYGDNFSIRCGISAFCRDFLCMTIDLLFGWPAINHGDVDAKLMEERMRFITCELSVKSSHRRRVMDFWDTYEQLMCAPRDFPLKQTDAKHPPYRFITPSRIQIDLRLHNSLLLDRCLAVINELRQATRVGWFQDFKESAIARFRDEGKSLNEIKQLVRQSGLREYASRLFDAMRQTPSLQSVGEGIAEPLIQQATFSLILAEAKETFTNAWQSYREHAEDQLKQSHSWLYNISEWRRRRMERLEQQYLESHKFDIHEMVLSKCVEAGLDQHAFFISRDLIFLRDRERLLRDQLERSSSFADTQFVFRVPAQLLRHWKVYRRSASYRTNYVLVDTVLTGNRPSGEETIPQVKRSIKRSVERGAYEVIDLSQHRRPPRTDQELGPQDFEVHTASPKHVFCPPDTPYLDDGEEESRAASKPLLAKTSSQNKLAVQPEFVVQSTLVYKASTRYFMWRWLAFFVCTYSWMLRLGQLFFITIPFRSAFSLTALVQISPIYLRLELDQNTGYLFYNKSFYQDTIISRIIRIWRDIRASRIAFDATPSKGLFDKAAARPLHRIWSYVFRGFLTTVLILIVWPPLCLLISFISIAFGLTLPVTIPFINLVLHFAGLLFWDAYKPASKHNRLFPLVELIFGHLLIRSLLQTILAFLAVFVFCPLWSIVQFLWAFVHWFLRSVWDFVVFHVVIRPFARIPAREDLIIKRIAGPGTAENHFYRARPVDILLILVGQLELLELDLWRRQMEILADKPLDTYRRLVQSLSWLCLVPQCDGEPYATLSQKTKEWRTEIQSKMEERIQALQIHLKPAQLQRIKLSDGDLHHTLRMGAEITECFFQNRISTRLDVLNQDLASWWAALSLSADDYLGLCTTLLGRTFGEQIFTCITENDTVFPLQVREPSLTQQFQDFMLDMVSHKASFRSLDVIGIRDPTVLQTSSPMNEDDALSLASDAIAFNSDLMSQRCTVIPASPSKRRLNVNPEARKSLEDPISNLDKGTAVSFAFPDTLKTFQRRNVPDPIAFINIDLPMFPLSAFAPLSYRHLPLPLSSSPKLPIVNPLPCFTSQRFEHVCSCCICLTKADVDKTNRQKLLTHWGKSDGRELACICPRNGLREDNAFALHPVCTGLTTLLVEEEQELRRQFEGLTDWSTAGKNASAVRRSMTPVTNASSMRRCPTHGTLHINDNVRHTMFGDLFSCSNVPVKKPSSVVAAVENLGRVYHPAIITLLMHARDREHNPLDFTHPAIQSAVNLVTTPQKAFNLLHRLRGYDSHHPTPISYSPFHPTQSASSKLARDIRAAHFLRSKHNDDLDFLALSSRNLYCSAVASKWNSSAIERRQSLLLGASKDGRLALSGSLNNETPEIKATPTDITVRRYAANMDQSGRTQQSQQDPLSNDDRLNNHPLMLYSWEDPSAVVAGYWSGMDSPNFGMSDMGNSTGTPSLSLYGTEDAATTDDLDETGDALSVSSLNQINVVETIFNANRPNQIAFYKPADAMMVPKLLTTSATTAGSTEVGLDHRFNEESNERTLCDTASSLHIHSGQSSENCSTVINPGSCDMLGSFPEVSASTPDELPTSERMYSHPDLLKGAVNLSPHGSLQDSLPGLAMVADGDGGHPSPAGLDCKVPSCMENGSRKGSLDEPNKTNGVDDRTVVGDTLDTVSPV